MTTKTQREQPGLSEDELNKALHRALERIRSEQAESTAQWHQIQKAAKERARALVAEAAALEFIALAEDPIDAMCAIADLAALASISRAQQLARENNTPIPVAPAPVSRLLKGFVRMLAERLAKVYALLTLGEQQRLRHILPAAVKALEFDDPSVKALVVKLLPQTPRAIAESLRANLPILEERFGQ
jgi:hypothetical protein